MRTLLLAAFVASTASGLACSKNSGGEGTQAPGSSALSIAIAEGDRDAELWVDGNYVGVIGEFEDPRVGAPLLAPGVHRVEVRKPGRFPVQKTVEIPSDAPERTVVAAELLPDPR